MKNTLVVVFGLQKNNMVTIKLMGGIGNQMFEYAFIKSLSHQHNFTPVLETGFYKKNKLKIGLKNILKLLINLFTKSNFGYGLNEIRQNKRQYDLKYFKLDDKIKKIKNSNFPIIREVDEYCFNEKIITKAKDNTSYVGYFNNEKYFSNISEIIHNDFQLKEKYQNLLPSDLLHKIETTISVSVHVRRGDYVSSKIIQEHHGVCSINYYRQAVKLIKDKLINPVFFIFSDDIEWCQKNLNLECNVIYVSNLKNYQDLILMSKCRHNIIANSTFSWWGGWLNKHPEKIIIAPKSWLKEKRLNTTNLIPNTWIKL